MPKLLEVLGWWVNTLPPPGSKGLAKARLPLANHALVEDKSIVRWSRENKMPIGETFFFVAFFLESFFGVTIDEISCSNEPEINKLARTFGSRVITLSRLAVHLDFVGRTDSIFRMLHGKAGTSDERLKKIQSINTAYSSQVELIRKNISHLKYGSSQVDQKELQTTVPEIVVPEVKMQNVLSASEEAVLTYAEMSIRSVMEVMERLVAPDNSKLRDEFRKRTPNVLGRFAKLSSALTSELARSARISDGLSLHKEKE